MDNTQEELQIREEYNIWKNNVHLLYDLAMIHSLEWPSMTVEWLPMCENFSNEGYSLHHLYLATHTSDNQPNYITKSSIQLQDDFSHEGPEYSEFPTQGISGKITVEQRILHDGDVNKMRLMPQNPMIVATKAASGLVNVFDTSLFPSVPESDDIKKTLELTGHDAEGYGLDWSPLRKGLLASGSDDCKVCCWDINAQTTPLCTFADRSCIIEDVNWHPRDDHVLAAVGDDGYLVLYDVRQSAPSSLIQAHQKECNVIRFNPHEPHLFITASSDTTIALWDQRNSAFPLHVLEGHTGAVFSGVWSPFQRNILATSGLDRRVIIWDLNRIGEEQTEEEAEDGPAELLFIHGGHTSKVNDIAWNPNREWVLASAADDNILQVWKMAESIYDEKKYDVGNLDESLFE